VTWAFEFENQPVFAGFRELATGGRVGSTDYLVDKPVLNVFRMMGMMGGQYLAVKSSGAIPVDQVVETSVRAAPDVNAVATRSEHQVDVLLWNYHDDDIEARPASISLSVTQLRTRKVRVQRFLMDGSHSNAYAVWRSMGSPEHPTAKQFDELQRAGKLASGSPDAILITKDGTAKVDFELERQGVTLVRFLW